MSKREIKFRGMRKDLDIFAFGDLIQKPPFVYILAPVDGAENIGRFERHEVIPDTLGQYTGEKDQDGNEIYEGDNVEYEWYDESVGLWQHTSATVWFNTGSFQPLLDVLSTRNFKIVK